MAGLSVRTIQRIERGHKASFESLKSLVSVLEVNISALEQEIDMIAIHGWEFTKRMLM